MFDIITRGKFQYIYLDKIFNKDIKRIVLMKLIEQW